MIRILNKSLLIFIFTFYFQLLTAQGGLRFNLENFGKSSFPNGQNFGPPLNQNGKPNSDPNKIGGNSPSFIGNFDDLMRNLGNYGNIDLGDLNLRTYVTTDRKVQNPVIGSIDMKPRKERGYDPKNLINDPRVAEIQTAALMGMNFGTVAQFSTDGQVRTMLAMNDESNNECVNNILRQNPNLSRGEAADLCQKLRVENTAAGSKNNPATKSQNSKDAILLSGPIPNILGVFAAHTGNLTATRDELDRIKNLYSLKLPSKSGGIDYKVPVRFGNFSEEIAPSDPRALFLSEFNIMQKIQLSSGMNSSLGRVFHEVMVARMRYLLGDAVLVKFNETDAGDFTFTPGALARIKPEYEHLGTCGYDSRFVNYLKLITRLLMQMAEKMCLDFNDSAFLDQISTASGLAENFDNFDLRKITVSLQIPPEMPEICYHDLYEINRKFSGSGLYGSDFLAIINPSNNKIITPKVFNSIRKLGLVMVGLAPASNSKNDKKSEKKSVKFEYMCSKTQDELNKIERVFSKVNTQNYRMFLGSIAEHISKDINEARSSSNILSSNFVVPEEFGSAPKPDSPVKKNADSSDSSSSSNADQIVLTPLSVLIIKLAGDLADAKIKHEISTLSNDIYTEIMKQSTMFERSFYNSKITVLDWMLSKLTYLANQAAGTDNGVFSFTRNGLMGVDLKQLTNEQLKNAVDLIIAASELVGNGKK